MISLLLINYRSSGLALNAIRSARAASAAPIQVVVVDNSCDEAEAGALRSAADVLVVPETNLGYAGGINLGRRRCDGEALVVVNPDIVFERGSLDILVDALQRAAVAGPALFWDTDFRWHLPPGDRYTALERLDVILAARSRHWRSERDRRRLRQRLAFWSLRSEVPVRTLSGAVMAIRAGVFDELEGFDERFPLYFEETDFLRRLSEQRERMLYVPAARCCHLYNQSASQVGGEAGALYAQSELRYLEKWNGPLLARVLKRAERPLPAVASVPVQGPIAVPATGMLVEASPLPSFDTAAGLFAEQGEVDVPANAWTSPAPVYLRVLDPGSGHIVGTYMRCRS